MDCILCNESNTVAKLGSKGKYSILKCQNCGLGYTTPLPTEDELVQFYNKRTLEEPKRRGGLGRKITSHVRAYDIKQYLSDTRSLRILEIGCGQGDLLHALNKDNRALTTGVTLSGLSLKDPRLNVIRGTLKSSSFQNDSFDAVVAIQVLEHISDPISELNEIYRVLAPGGIFYATMPCITHIKAKLSGINWKYFGPPGHLWYFSPKTIRLLFEKCGFKTLFTSCFYNKAHLKAVCKKI